MSDDLLERALNAYHAVPYGYCHCGCGQKTTVGRKTDRAWGVVAGEPRRFIIGHNKRLAMDYREEDRGHGTLCWIWQRHVSALGYGTIGRDGQNLAHRWSYEQLVGPIPDGLELDHLCRVRCCVNPDHLEPVTRAENVRRSWASRKAERAAA